VGTIEKAGARRAGSGKKKIEKGAFLHPPLFFFYQIPLVPRPLFRSSLLTESLEQASLSEIKESNFTDSKNSRMDKTLL